MQAHVWMVVLAQDTQMMNEGGRQMRWGMTGVGVGILIVAFGVLFSKSKSSMGMQWIQRVIGFILAVLGIAAIAYAWIGLPSV